MEAVEVGRHRDPEGGDDSEEENVAMMDGSNEEGPEIKLLRSFFWLVASQDRSFLIMMVVCPQLHC